MSANVESSGSIRWVRRKAFYTAGDGTLMVPMSMHKDNRTRLLDALRKRPEVPEAGAVIILQGGSEQSVYDTDTEWEFKQESNFQYLFGVKEPGCWAALRVSDGKAVLFVPALDESYSAWMGPVKPAAWFQSAYEVDEVYVLEEGTATLATVVEGSLQATMVLSPKGTNRDSGSDAPQPVVKELKVPFNDDASKALYVELAEARLVKSSDELKILQYANDVSSLAHIDLMQSNPAKSSTREYIAAANFRFQAALRGCSRVGYTCICPSGPRNTYLHYGHPGEPNAERVVQGSLTLRDMGAEYHGYTADVTCTYPVSGKFSPEQQVVYDAVWAAVLAVEETIKPGVSYKDMHRLAQRTMLTEMKAGGLFVGEVEDMMAVNLMNNFMFHGLGHSLGLDVHDVGGYEPGVQRKDDPSIQENLRLGRKLKEGMVLTVEPGFYFTPYLMDAALADASKSKFIDRGALEKFRSVGGIRIEDDVVITANGCRLLTNVPRTVEEIEAVMAGQPWVVGASTCREYVDGQLA